MRAIVLASTALVMASVALASTDPVADTRQIMAGTVTTPKIIKEYLSGARDGTAPFQGALKAYKAVRAAETPVPPPLPPVPPPAADPLLGEAPIADNFNLALMLQPSWGTGALAPIANDVVGAFRFQCNPGQLLYDDPIVFPGQPGKSHLHQFYGNTGANAFSNYASLRTTGQSTCGTVPVNRSAYWQPAMLDGKGNVIRPLASNIYYKRRPASDPLVSDPANKQYQGKAVPMPNGLKFIFGFDMVSGKAPTGSFDYICVKSDGNPLTGIAYKTLKELADTNTCLPGMEVWSRGHSPTCWNGKDLDSQNHRDHMAYASRRIDDGAVVCPSTHPYVVADFQLSSNYRIIPGDDLHLWRLASDDMHPELPPGSTFHADFFMAWSPEAHSGALGWEGPNGCINRKANCSGGDLGTGKQVIGMWYRPEASAPNRVPIPALP